MEIEEILKINSDFSELIKKRKWYSNIGISRQMAYNLKKRFLRIHDLKTGETSASFNQLMIYMALFCLEYDYRPTDIEAELRLYQLDDVQIHLPEPEQILNIMDKIIRFDKAIEKTKIGG